MITYAEMESLKRLYSLVKTLRNFSTTGRITFQASPAESAALEELLRSIVEGEFDDSAPVSASWVFGWLLKYSKHTMLPVRYQEGLFNLVAHIASKQEHVTVHRGDEGTYGPGIRMAFDKLMSMAVNAEDNSEAAILLDAAVHVLGVLDNAVHSQED